jgi:DNA-binding CsgD family transcriptional regulator
VAKSAAFARSQARVGDVCDRAADSRTLRQQVLAEIARVVDFDAYVWLLTDPETSVGSAPLADVPAPLLPLLPRLIGLKYLTTINRWTTLDSSAASLHESTGADLSLSRLWRELLSGYGVVDMASCVFRDRFGCWGFLDLWRAGAGAQFTTPEITYLTSIIEVLTRALRRCQANTFAVRSVERPRRPGPVVLLLSPELQVLGQTPETHEYLRVLVPPQHRSAPIPASAYNVGAQLLAVEAGVDRNPPSARVHLSEGLWVSLRAARIGQAESCGQSNIAVTIEETSPTERVSLFGRAFGLSARETELLGHLVTGADTKELARRMFLSEHTVQDHLKSMFSKTSTRNRRSLLSRALGT